METQIGGKYDERDSSLFDLKKRLQNAGVQVTYPASEGIVKTVDGRGYTFDPDETSFYEVETDYYRSIAESDFHTVNNRFVRNLGYIGASAALEMTYAMVQQRPILLMHPPDYAPTVELFCRDLLEQREDLASVHDVMQMDDDAIMELAQALGENPVDYDLSSQEREQVLARVQSLFESIRAQEEQ